MDRDVMFTGVLLAIGPPPVYDADESHLVTMEKRYNWYVRYAEITGRECSVTELRLFYQWYFVNRVIDDNLKEI